MKSPSTPFTVRMMQEVASATVAHHVKVGEEDAATPQWNDKDPALGKLHVSLRTIERQSVVLTPMELAHLLGELLVAANLEHQGLGEQ